MVYPFDWLLSEAPSILGQKPVVKSAGNKTGGILSSKFQRRSQSMKMVDGFLFVLFFLLSEIPGLTSHSALASAPGPAPAPRANEVCFSPDEGCDEKLAQFIASARNSLDIAVFDLTLDQIAHQILVQSRKIPVRVLVDRRQAKGKHSLVRLLIKGGVQVRLGYQRGIMHHKFAIVDGRAVETGSFNYTSGAARSNQENQVYLWTPEVVARYKNRFESSWREARPVSSLD